VFPSKNAKEFLAICGKFLSTVERIPWASARENLCGKGLSR
jgi:hypothetical protein